MQYRFAVNFGTVQPTETLRLRLVITLKRVWHSFRVRSPLKATRPRSRPIFCCTHHAEEALFRLKKILNFTVPLTLQRTGGGAVSPSLPCFLPFTQDILRQPIPENSWPCKPFCCGCPYEKTNKKCSFTLAQSTLKNWSKNLPCLRGLEWIHCPYKQSYWKLSQIDK